MRYRVPAAGLVIATLLLAVPASASAAVKISKIQFDPPGADNGSNTSLNGEWVIIENSGNHAVTLTGWTLRDVDRHVYRFPSFRLRGGKSVKVHTGSGTDDRNDLYWDSDGYVWNNDGDTAILKDDGGRKIDKCRYSGSGSSVTC